MSSNPRESRKLNRKYHRIESKVREIVYSTIERFSGNEVAAGLRAHELYWNIPFLIQNSRLNRHARNQLMYRIHDRLLKIQTLRIEAACLYIDGARERGRNYRGNNHDILIEQYRSLTTAGNS